MAVVEVPKKYSPFILTPEEIAFLVEKVAVIPSEQPRAIAIALAESGGNIFALNSSGFDESYGLWQINMKGVLGPERRERLKLKSNEDLYDPLTNANAMQHISSSGANWKPWSVYTTQSYWVHMNRAQEAVKNPVDPTPRLNKEVGARVDAAANPLDKLLNWIKEQMLRVAAFVGGGVLLILAIILYVRSQT